MRQTLWLDVEEYMLMHMTIISTQFQITGAYLSIKNLLIPDPFW